MQGVLTFVLLAAGALLLTLTSARRGNTAAALLGPPVRRGIDDAPLLLDLMAAMLDAGSSVENALAVVAGAADAEVGAALARVRQARLLGAPWEDAWAIAAGGHVSRSEGRHRVRRAAVRESGQTIDAVRQGLHFAVVTGAPSAALLRAHAQQIRRRRNREGDRRAAALGVHLVLPLGLCSLPAFICLGVVPVVLGLMPTL